MKTVDITTYAKACAAGHIHHKQDAEDAAGLAVFKALTVRRDQPNASDAYMRSVIANAVRDEVRRLTTKNRFHVPMRAESDYESDLGDLANMSADDVGEIVSLRMGLERAVQELTAHERRIVNAIADGLTMTAVAKMLGFKTRRHVTTALSRMRGRLAEAGIEAA
jgi:DNA-binding NarL/FixJ family response regulator